MDYFDYQSVAAEAGIRHEKVQQLAQLVRSEFPFDDMMSELHMLRACMAIRDGYVTIDEALKPEGKGPKKLSQ